MSGMLLLASKPRREREVKSLFGFGRRPVGIGIVVDQPAEIPSFSSACRTLRTGMPSKVPIARRSWSPVTMPSAPAPSAQARIWTSSGSRNAAGTGMVGPSTISDAARKRETISCGLRPRWANRLWNRSRWSTCSNSARTAPEAHSMAAPSSRASNKREGFPCHSVPDTNTFISTTSFTRAPFRPGSLYLGIDLVRGQRLARRGPDLIQGHSQSLPSAPAPHFLSQQFRHPAVLQQPHLARLLNQSLGQIQLNRDTH